MSCKTLPNNILQYIDMELSDYETKAIEDHINLCVECRQLLASISSTYKLIDFENKWKASPSFRSTLIEKKINLRMTGIASIAMKFIKPLAVAASISLGVIIGNGELDLLVERSAEIELAESLTPLNGETYSVWTVLNLDDGN